MLETCQACADLSRDLLAIVAATRSLPTAATAPRDFRLTPDQAARLRRTSWLRTVLAPFSGARSATRPVAAAFTTLGVAGLLLATLLPGALGSAGSAPERDLAQPAAVTSAASAAPAAEAPGATADTGGNPQVVPAAGRPSQASDVEYGMKGSTSAPPDVAVAGPTTTRAAAPEVLDSDARLRASVDAPSPLFIGSVALLAIGLLLFGLRLAGRRLR
jgi:hypothetical protein